MLPHKIAIIVVWFGKVPPYFQLWLRSLKANTGYKFFFVTDQTLSGYDFPPNFQAIPSTFSEMKKKISQKLSLNLSFEHAYKFCDFKPAYGELFQDYLEGYKFWGNCDVDMMFGKLDNFITPELLERYQKILIRGHLTLYRNVPNINSLYRSSEKIDYRKIYESPEYCLFDEWLGINKIAKELGIDQYQSEIMADINPNHPRFFANNLENFSKQVFVWKEGRVFQYFLRKHEVHSKELAYIHFQKRNMSLIDTKVYSATIVILNSFGFFAHEGDINTEVIKRYDKPNFHHYFSRQYKRLIKRIPVLNRNINFNKKLVK